MYRIKQIVKKELADTSTPVSIYLRIRDRYVNSFLLESSDYHGHENSMSFICCDALASITVHSQKVSSQLPNKGEQHIAGVPKDLKVLLKDFLSRFEVEKTEDLKFSVDGLFGYMSYDAVQYFEDIVLETSKEEDFEIPLCSYSFFRFIIAFDHFQNTIYIIENVLEGNESRIEALRSIIHNRNTPFFSFQRVGEERSTYKDSEFLGMVHKGIEHCLRGDVFQIVLSRRFQNTFRGDDFQVYRALRSINPSPYLFYFDYGNFRIFGSSPEAQLVIKNKKAIIYPIAGTFRRSGNDSLDAELAKKLANDPKENSEHNMLVDLARNDLSVFCENITVETLKEIQYYSHVIHLVSKVSGIIKDGHHVLDVVAATFPAGTVSGAPKYKAMQLIDLYEKKKRGFYSGAIGFIGFNEDFNHALLIRSFLSQKNTLFFQAGAGIVAKSIPENEVKEVDNKLIALKESLILAENISKKI
ncbi:MAG: anthranilate synthase component I family protein [Chitinophagaceae bacterium]|nr:anthranilate synthase component I family protein [Chitinophagaceae bacterium]